jgi:hypothetical protein
MIYRILCGWVFLFLAISPVSANGSSLACDHGKPNARIKCTNLRIDDLTARLVEQSRQIDGLLGRIGDLETKLGALETRFNALPGNLKDVVTYGSIISLQSARLYNPPSPPVCLDLDTNGANHVQAWRCNNDNDHRAQHWSVTRPQ